MKAFKGLRTMLPPGAPWLLERIRYRVFGGNIRIKEVDYDYLMELARERGVSIEDALRYVVDRHINRVPAYPGDSWGDIVSRMIMREKAGA